MPVDLSKPAEQVSVDAAAYQPLFQNLQGNILKAHGRDRAWHLFLKFTGTPANVRKWIREQVAPKLFTAAVQYEQGRQRDANPAFDGGLITLFFLSAAGYRFLGLDPNKLASQPFRRGMKDRSDGLSEISSTNNKDPRKEQWQSEFQQEVHALLVLGDDHPQEANLQAALTATQSQLSGLGTIVVTEKGRVLRRPNADTPDPTDFEPIEHFGYFDGISQPLFTKEDVDKYYEKKVGTRGASAWKPHASLDLVLVDDPFTDAADAFGSYFVFRKLGQDLATFEQRVSACAAAIGAQADLAGAMAVGRFKDRTPVVKHDQPVVEYDNDFMFDELDEDGFACPRHAHIRKVNPRGTTPMTSLEEERKRRIVRRGIPYGRPHPSIGCDPAISTNAPNEARGLLFMCYQASIKKQFEFIQRTWVDNPNFPVSLLNPFAKDTGDDPLIGQDKDEGQRWPKKWGDQSAGRKTFNFESAVTLKGGEYFFAPSKPFLAAL